MSSSNKVPHVQKPALKYRFYTDKIIASKRKQKVVMYNLWILLLATEGESRVYFRSLRMKSPGQYYNSIPKHIQTGFYFILRKRCDCASSGPTPGLSTTWCLWKPFVLQTWGRKTWNASTWREGWKETQAGWAAQEKKAVFGVFWTSTGVVASTPSRIYACVARKISRNQI